MKKNILIIICVISIFSCKKEEDYQNSFAVIQPLQVGYSWKYLDTNFSNTGNPVSKDTTFLSITGIHQVNIDGTDVTLYEWSWNWMPHLKLLCNNDVGGFYFYGSKTDTRINILDKNLYVKFPILPNESWSSSDYLSRNFIDSTALYVIDDVTKRCESTNEIFNTKAGAFKCYKIHSTEKNTDTYTYYSPGIGYVGCIQMTDGKIVYTKTLVSYNLSTEGVSKNIKPVNSSSTSKNSLDTIKLLY